VVIIANQWEDAMETIEEVRTKKPIPGSGKKRPRRKKKRHVYGVIRERRTRVEPGKKPTEWAQVGDSIIYGCRRRAEEKAKRLNELSNKRVPRYFPFEQRFRVRRRLVF
jgi:hypothetical protein